MKNDVRRLAYFRLIALLTVSSLSLLLVASCSRATAGHRFSAAYFFHDEWADTVLEFGEKDDAGVVLWQNPASGEWLYHPVRIAQICIGYFGGVTKTGKQIYKTYVRAQADWLVNNLQQRGQNVWVWEYSFPLTHFAAQAGWASAMAQGQGISCLLRAHQLFRKDQYLTAAHKALSAFLFPIEEGGVTWIDTQGRRCPEGVAVLPPAHILNEALFALWGLYEYSLYTSSRVARDLFNEGLSCYIDLFPYYDKGPGEVTRYDLLTRSLLFHLRGLQEWHPPPRDYLPVDRMRLIRKGISLLDIGTSNDDVMNILGSFVYSEMDWTERRELGGRTVRAFYRKEDASYPHGAFRLALPSELPWLGGDEVLQLEIEYRDDVANPVAVEVWDGEVYHQLGTIGGENNRLWKVATLRFPARWIEFGGRINIDYHKLVVQQLETLCGVLQRAEVCQYAQRWRVFEK